MIRNIIDGIKEFFYDLLDAMAVAAIVVTFIVAFIIVFVTISLTLFQLLSIAELDNTAIEILVIALFSAFMVITVAELVGP